MPCPCCPAVLYNVHFTALFQLFYWANEWMNELQYSHRCLSTVFCVDSGITLQLPTINSHLNDNHAKPTNILHTCMLSTIPLPLPLLLLLCTPNYTVTNLHSSHQPNRFRTVLHILWLKLLNFILSHPSSDLCNGSRSMNALNISSSHSPKSSNN